MTTARTPSGRRGPSRRQVLIGAAATIGLSACTGRPTPSSDVPSLVAGLPTPPVDPDLHLVRRLTFGARVEDLDRLREVGRATWFDEQLDPASLDTSQIDDQLAALPELGLDAAELLERYRDDGERVRVVAALRVATLVRHVASPAQLHERLVEFWGDHFNVPQQDPASIALKIVDDREVVRPMALGRFADLLVASAQSPAMLRYLDNARSSAGAINENYAREVLELHTVGVDGGYSEDDVVAVARLLTGWTVDPRQLVFRFDPRRHDDGPVTALGWTRPGGGDPLAHGTDFLHHVAGLRATAEHVSRKLAVRFVGDEPPDDLVDAMADAWQANDSAIRPVLRTMVEHEAFADAPAKFLRPWDHLVQTLRATGATIELGDGRAGRERIAALVRQIDDLGQVPFRWPAPNGFPDTASAWRNAGGLLARWEATARLVTTDELATTPGLDAAIGAQSGRSGRDAVAGLCVALRAVTPTPQERDLLLGIAGWDPAQPVPERSLSSGGQAIAFALLTGPDAMHR